MKKFTSLLLAIVMIVAIAIAALPVNAEDYTAMTIPEALAAADDTLVSVSGTVTEVSTWNDNYSNMNATISDADGKTLYIYRLATKVELGDIITVKGKMATYNGSRQIAQGATATITGHTDITIDYKDVTIAQANTEADDTYVSVSGTVTEIKGAWNDNYKNMNVYISDGAGNTLYIYRLATKVELGDIVTVKGKMATYNGARQIAEGSTAEITGKDTTVTEEATTTEEVTTQAPSVPAGPLLENATLADFASFNTDTNTSYGTERTNAAGWTAKCAIFSDKAFTNGATLIVLNGKSSDPGSLTSAVITGGIDKLAFNYGFAFSDKQFALDITVKSADGATVLKNIKIEKTDLAQNTEYSEIVEIGVAQDCILVITNACLGGQSGNKERVGLYNLQWTTPAAEVTTEEITTEEITTEEVTTAEVTTAEVTTEEITAEEITTAVETEEVTDPGQAPAGGDNGVFFAVAAVAVVILAGTAVIARKREN